MVGPTIEAGTGEQPARRRRPRHDVEGNASRASSSLNQVLGSVATADFFGCRYLPSEFQRHVRNWLRHRAGDRRSCSRARRLDWVEASEKQPRLLDSADQSRNVIGVMERVDQIDGRAVIALDRVGKQGRGRPVLYEPADVVAVVVVLEANGIENANVVGLTPPAPRAAAHSSRERSIHSMIRCHNDPQKRGEVDGNLKTVGSRAAAVDRAPASKPLT
jgi:hypothetical protein